MRQFARDMPLFLATQTALQEMQLPDRNDFIEGTMHRIIEKQLEESYRDAKSEKMKMAVKELFVREFPVGF